MPEKMPMRILFVRWVSARCSELASYGVEVGVAGVLVVEVRGRRLVVERVVVGRIVVGRIVADWIVDWIAVERIVEWVVVLTGPREEVVAIAATEAAPEKSLTRSARS